MAQFTFNMKALFFSLCTARQIELGDGHPRNSVFTSKHPAHIIRSMHAIHSYNSNYAQNTYPSRTIVQRFRWGKKNVLFIMKFHIFVYLAYMHMIRTYIPIEGYWWRSTQRQDDNNQIHKYHPNNNAVIATAAKQ